MARFEYMEAVATNAPSTKALEAGRRAIATQGADVKASGSHEVRGQAGSNLRTRLLGATFGSVKDFPVLITAASKQASDETVITITAAEAFGFGSLGGVEGKVRGRCQQLADTVATDVVMELRQAGFTASRPL
jgi:hypothetical protein